MSKLSKKVEETKKKEELHLNEVVKNYMGGDSYSANPLQTLELLASSSIFREPKYYGFTDEQLERIKTIKSTIDDSLLNDFIDDFYKGFLRLITGGKEETSVAENFERAIDASLDFDFEGTLQVAKKLRHEFKMRLNPQIIMVRAALHPKRKEFSSKNPKLFGEIEDQVMVRADEPMTQLAYFMYLNGGKKNNIPTILKKAIAKKLSSLDKYEVNKYKNHEIGMVNSVRISHAHSDVIDELMKTGRVKVDTDKKTWEQLKSEGKSWADILKTIKLGHMALLRNLCNIFTEIDDENVLNEQLNILKSGVLHGNQLPFRYWSAYKTVEKNNSINFKPQILDALEDCLEISIKVLPRLKGRTMCLSDNSGSAWGQFVSEFGKVSIAEIDNLSSVIAAKCSDEGYVGKFGDRLIVKPVKKTDGTLSQAKALTENSYRDVGASTEGGIWEFFKNAIEKKDIYDNIFIFSDQQAGTGELYGSRKQSSVYRKAGYSYGHNCINVFKLIVDYRKTVNPKVNVYSVQTGGYTNSLVPVNCYRTSMLYGWTGREILYADYLQKVFDNIDGESLKKS